MAKWATSQQSDRLAQIPFLPLTGWIQVDTFLNLSVRQFSYLKNVDNSEALCKS